MVKRLRRRYDCKTNVEKAMSNMGYLVNSNKQEYLKSKECIVLYTDVRIDIESQMSYNVNVEIMVQFTVDDNNRLPYDIIEVLKNITDYVENSDAENSTSFIFKRLSVDPLGELINVQMYGETEFEVDWISEVDWCGPNNTEPEHDNPISF